ncbi:hypothetical protein D9619_008513 [Psilocybe cf. subviscida]|uniref:FAD/NAD(P)-binding domain-containing protein n=1 Tax=Psilocybe cf. subviscida TaxID=2480587 RepID=A0A8H5F0U5_9AGAR|nr:hypothetical protein D9619_008513 [Psilocybe cf. subviscida]
MPRFAVLPGHEYKAFIPYTNVFLQNQEKEEQPEEEERERFTVLHAQITALQANTVTYKSLSPNREDSDKEETLVFDYAIYALGAHMPPPLDLWGSASFPATSPSFYPSPSGDDKEKGVTKYHGLKTEGCAFFVAKQAEIARVAAAEGGGSVLVVGGGALGIQFATDIKAVYPSTAVTLLHSRERLLPRFGEGMHDEVLRSCDALGVKVILGERLDLGSLSTNKEVATQEGEARTQRVVRTVTGREIVADLVLMCTGQTPNTTLLAGLDDALVEPRSRHARVHRTMQVAGRTMYEEDQQAPSAALTSAVAEHAKGGAEVKDAVEALASLALTESAKNRDAKDTPYPHIFAIGDAAAAFGAIPAGHNAYAQGEVAARNVFRLIDRAEVGAKKGSDGEEEPLEEYTPGPPAIKVSLGLERAVYQVGPNIGVKTDGVPDLQAAAIWPYFGIKVEKDEDMRA